MNFRGSHVALEGRGHLQWSRGGFVDQYLAANSHNFDEEQDPDTDQHKVEKRIWVRTKGILFSNLGTVPVFTYRTCTCNLADMDCMR
jgi:hypothetical protein